ncbi:hypothetical protein BH23PLA1_BH23PLA1_21810 [soil metagenome]
MARKKTPRYRVNIKAELSTRLKEIRQELFGEHGGPELARRLNLPARTWYNYETGVTVPAEVLLAFIDQTGTNPLWLLSGEGPKYRRGLEDQVLATLTPEELIRRGLEKLEQEPDDLVFVSPEDLPSESASDFVAVGLLAPEDLGSGTLRADRVGEYIMAYRQWLPHPRETVAMRLEDDSMSPILPAGSIVAIDRSIRTSEELQGRLVAAVIDGWPLVRWLEISGRHAILRPNQQGARHPLVALELDSSPSPIIGRIVWSWSWFDRS